MASLSDKTTGDFIQGYLTTGQILAGHISAMDEMVDRLEREDAAGVPPPIILDSPGYESLAHVLARAFEQASAGKGSERHAKGQPFDRQPMQTLCDLYGVGFALGQAAKKTQEAQRLPPAAAIRELLGAINYIAGAVIYLENHQ